VPPVQALAALHGLWFVLALAALMLVVGRLTPAQLRLLGLALTATGALGLLVFVGRDLINWLETVPPDFRRYSLQRILFTIATNTDVPFVQVTAAGAVCWIVGTLRKRRLARERTAISPRNFQTDPPSGGY
jgi:hypothetical protein